MNIPLSQLHNVRFVYLTEKEYSALTVHDPDVFYCILGSDGVPYP